MDNPVPSTQSYDPPRIEERSPLGTPLIGPVASGSTDNDSAAFYAI